MGSELNKTKPIKNKQIIKGFKSDLEHVFSLIGIVFKAIFFQSQPKPMLHLFKTFA